MFNTAGNDRQGMGKERCRVLDNGGVIYLPDLNPTTRRYPRTLREAFPQDARTWIDDPPDSIHVWDICVIAAAVILWVFAVYCWSVA